MLYGSIGSRSYFSVDDSTAIPNFRRGCIDIEVDRLQEADLLTWDQNLDINMTINAWKIKNIGSLEGNVFISDISIEQSGGIYTSAEQEAGDVDNNGDLDGYIDSELFLDIEKDLDYDSQDKLFFKGTLNLLPNAFDDSFLLEKDQEALVVWKMDFSRTLTNNICQGDELSFDITFRMIQAH